MSLKKPHCNVLQLRDYKKREKSINNIFWFGIFDIFCRNDFQNNEKRDTQKYLRNILEIFVTQEYPKFHNLVSSYLVPSSNLVSSSNSIPTY